MNQTITKRAISAVRRKFDLPLLDDAPDRQNYLQILKYLDQCGGSSLVIVLELLADSVRIRNPRNTTLTAGSAFSKALRPRHRNYSNERTNPDSGQIVRP